jgi:hypothetical protein
VLNIANGHLGYLPPAPLYRGPSLYTVWQTPYAEGSLEAVTDLAKKSLNLLINLAVTGGGQDARATWPGHPARSLQTKISLSGLK